MRALRILLLSGICVALVVFLDWRAIQSGFAVLPGDRYDAVILATILEHWFSFFRGGTSWSEVGYFYPYTRTIAQTDAYFLVGILYSPFRAMGFDVFVATHFASLALKAIGFVGMYVYGRRMARWPFGWAVVAAVIFTASNGMTSHSQRLQLETVAFAPWLGLALQKAVAAFWSNDKRASLVWGGLTAVGLGLWCLTCFYMAWFFAYLYMFVAVVYVVYRPAYARELISNLVRSPAVVLAVVVIGLLALLPFISVYWPKSMETGVRSYASVSANLPKISSVMQVGDVNFVFGKLYVAVLRAINTNYAPSGGEYYNTGFNPALFFLYCASGIYLLKRVAGPQLSLRIFWIATTASWLTTLSFGGPSLWWLVYHVVPGAKALNVVLAYQLLLAFPVVVLAVELLASTKWEKFYAPALIVFVLFIAEINEPYLGLERKVELERIARIPAPPLQCKSFYVTAWDDQEKMTGFNEWINGYYAHNVSAMLIAQFVQIPTLNGIASFNPPDWVFGYPWKADYNQRVMNYASAHGVLDGLCRLDLSAKKWSTSVQ